MINLIQNLHLNGLIHRDIKPSNFAIDDNGNLHLIDFGSSKKFLHKDGTHKNEKKCRRFVGTPEFASITSHLGLS